MLKTDRTTMSNATAEIENTQQTGKEVRKEQSLHVEGERQQLMDLPLWLVLTDHAESDDTGKEKRLLMADWLLRRGGMDRVPIMGVAIPRTPKRKFTVESQRTVRPSPSLAHIVRAPKGQQADRLASMEQFLERLSTEKLSAERLSGEAAETLPLKDVVASGETERVTAESGEKTEDVTQRENPTQTVSQMEELTLRGSTNAPSRPESRLASVHTATTPEVVAATTPEVVASVHTTITPETAAASVHTATTPEIAAASVLTTVTPETAAASVHTATTPETGVTPVYTPDIPENSGATSSVAKTPENAGTRLSVAKTPKSDTESRDSSIMTAVIQLKAKEEAEASKGKEHIENIVHATMKVSCCLN
ncbi:hypothetical protein OESDEN_05849 [Oesophagostomum dentatum]|uniref:Uncharacterized protein n=1 Tax=Oesophagostomum dentatum TaxID=61180 RepID=A0A0B1T9K3_OESDE|nr:hypothetical protein OESDEN_05849 [Oesophagostomum dentatum]